MKVNDGREYNPHMSYWYLCCLTPGQQMWTEGDTGQLSVSVLGTHNDHSLKRHVYTVLHRPVEASPYRVRTGLS